jgi:hypothetical protein
MASFEFCNDRTIKAVCRPQLKFLLNIVEHVDSTGLGAGELGRLGNDGGQYGFKIDRRIHRLRYFS